MIEVYPEIPESFRWTTHKERAVPKSVSFRWIIDDATYSCSVKFDEEEIFKAFRDVFGDSPNTEAELVVYINDSRTDATVALKSKYKEIALFDGKIIVKRRK